MSICLGKSSRIACVLLSLLWLGACAELPAFKLPDPLVEPARAASDGNVRPENVEVGSQLIRTQKLPVLEVSRWQGNKDQRWQRLQLPEENVDLNVEAMPLNQFLHVALGDVLGLSFDMDEKVSKREEPVTLRISKPVSSQRLLAMIEQTVATYQVGLAWDAGSLTPLYLCDIVKSPQII